MSVQTTPTVALDRKAQAAIRQLRTLRATRDDLDARIKVQEAKVKEALGDHEEGTVGGRPVVTWRKVIRRTLSKTLVEKHQYGQEIIEDCTVISEVRTFKLLEDV
jgi:hypothetical protein